MMGYTTAVHSYQMQLQQQQQQQQAVTASSSSDRKLLQSGGRSPSYYSPEFAAAYTAAVQKYLIQLQQQQQQQQQVAAASASNAASGADGSRRLLQTGGRAPGFSAEFVAAYTAAVQKHQAEVRLQQQQQQGAAPMSDVESALDGGRKLLQTGGRAPSYNEAFMAGYNAAVQQYQALLLQQKQQQQQAQPAAAAASKPAGSSGN
jgi:hypothetical protein